MPLIRPNFAYCLLVLSVLLHGCDGAWNNPYPDSDAGQNILYSSFDERPKHLDPAQSYVENEIALTAQIYEPPFQYHYLKRPYTLIPLAAAAVPEPAYFDAAGQRLSEASAVEDIAYTLYDIKIKPGIRYQPHPAFAQDAAGNYRYHNLAPTALDDIQTPADFEHSGSRELLAADYVYQIKRLAHPRVQSPILGLMGEYIVGLKDYAGTLDAAYQKVAQGREKGVYLDLAAYPLEGATVLDRYTYRIKVRGKYPQILYWLAMPFFAPVAPEVDRFYTQPGMEEKNLSLDWYPVGTGPYMLTVNNPSRKMVLERNPNYHGETYPTEGQPEDVTNGLLADAGKPLPFIDRVIFSVEKESIPTWNKFLQGYYDRAGISSDSFDQAIRIGGQGDATLTDEMQQKGIKLTTSVATSTSYFGFNMLDPVVGGDSERARKLRRAIAIAIDYEEFISIFRNGRGIAGQGPLPPGIFGYVEGEKGINPYVYDWVNGKPQRKSIAEARRLLTEAGYPNGRDAQSGKPLLLNFDTTATGADDKALSDWMRKQFQKLNLQLIFRNTDFNRFQEKMRKGNAQLWMWGWNADYPDPENFMFLLYGPNGKANHNGENAANYSNPEFDRLFEQMKNMESGPERQVIIDQMLEVARRDSPWIWGFHPKDFVLSHAWYYNGRPGGIINNGLKYARIEPALRTELRARWNEPVLWPLGVLLIVLLLSAIPAVVTYLRRQRKTALQAGKAG